MGQPSESAAKHWLFVLNLKSRTVLSVRRLVICWLIFAILDRKKGKRRGKIGAGLLHKSCSGGKQARKSRNVVRKGDRAPK